MKLVVTKLTALTEKQPQNNEWTVTVELVAHGFVKKGPWT